MAAEKPTDFLVDLGELADFEPYTGGQAVYLGYEGNCRGTLISLEPAKDSQAGNKNVRVTVRLDAPEVEGQIVSGVKAVAGNSAKMKLGWNLGRMLYAAGYSLDDIKGMAPHGKVNVSELKPYLEGKPTIVRLATGATNKGHPVTNIDDFVSPETFEQAPKLQKCTAQAGGGRQGTLGSIGGLGGATASPPAQGSLLGSPPPTSANNAPPPATSAAAAAPASLLGGPKL